MTSALYIKPDVSHGYGHVTMVIGSVNLDDREPRFAYCDAAHKDYGPGYAFTLTCQLGGADREGWQREPYAITLGIDCRSLSDGVVVLERMAGIAKAAAALQRKLDKLRDTLGAPISFEDHALHLFLATKPELMVASKASGWYGADEFKAASADGVRQAVRAALWEVKRQLFPEKQETAA